MNGKKREQRKQQSKRMEDMETPGRQHERGGKDG